MMGLAFAATLASAAIPAMAQNATPAMAQNAEEPSPLAEASQIPLVTESGRPDLYLEMPYRLGGFEPEIVMVRGEEHFADLGPDDPNRMALEGLLEDVGAEVDDLVSGYALVSQEGFFTFVVAIRVDGVESGTLWPAYQPVLFDDLEDASAEEASIGGKDVTVVTSVGEEGEYVELHVYDEGDTIWMLQGPFDVVEATITDLGFPLSAD